MAEKQSVTLVGTPSSVSARVALRPSGMSGTLMTTLGWIFASGFACATMPSASSAVTSADTGPSTMPQISSTTSSNTRPDFLMSEGFVVTPSITPQAAYVRMASTSAVSRKMRMVRASRGVGQPTPGRGPTGAVRGGAYARGCLRPGVLPRG